MTDAATPLDGLLAQAQRTRHFRDSVDPAAAVAASVEVTEFLRDRLDGLRDAAGLPIRPGTRRDGRLRAQRDAAQVTPESLGVFTFWDAPVSQAPPLVRACLAQLRRVHPDARILDGRSARELADIPDAVARRLEAKHPAHFSDFVRVSVLERHGGIWCDATCWAPAPLEPAVAPLLGAGALYPRWAPRQIGNWFIAATPGTLLIRMQRLALEAWWTERGDLPDYFLYHRIFEALVRLVPEFRGQWEAVPALSAAAAHLLQLTMMQPWSPGLADVVLGASIVQKLSYKYDAVPAGSMLDRLLAGGSL